MSATYGHSAPAAGRPWVRRAADGATTDVLPAPWNSRTRVHEYGGAAWTVAGGVCWFTDFADQWLYRLDPGAAEPVAVTPEPEVPSGPT